MTASKYIKFLLIATLCLISGKVWGNSDYYSKGKVESNPAGEGKIYVATKIVEGEPDWYADDATEKTNDKSGTSPSTVTYHFYADDSSDYHFLKWEKANVDKGTGAESYHYIYDTIEQKKDGYSTDNTLTYTAVFTPWYNIKYIDGITGTTPELSPSRYFKECTDDDYKFPSYSRTGYTFKGWKPDKNWGEKTIYTESDSFNGKSGNVILTAQLVIIKGTISLNPNGGSISPIPDYTDYDVTTNVTLPEPVRPGYSFVNWKVTSNSEGSWVKDETYNKGNIGSGHYGDVTLTAQWSPITYTITLEPNGGSISSTSLEYNITQNTVIPTPALDGYDFVKWNVTTASADGNWTAAHYPDKQSVNGMYGNVTLTAEWTPTKYLLIYDYNDGSGNTEEKEYHITETITIPTQSKTATTFNGWKASLDGEGNWDTSGVYAKDGNEDVSGKWGNVTLTAQWTPTEYNVAYSTGTAESFDGWEGGTAPSDKYTTVDGAMPKPIKNGYTFVGWKSNISTGGWSTGKTYTPEDSEFKFSGKWGDVTLTAQWDIASYTLTLDAAGGTVDPASIQYTITDKDVLPTPILEGCTFKNWKVTTAAGSWEIGNVYDAGESVEGKYGSATLTAQWQGVVKIIVSGLQSTKHHIIFTISGPSSGPSVTFNVSVSSSESLKDLKPGDYTISATDWHKLLYSVDGPSNFTVADSAIELNFTATSKNAKVGETASEF